MIVITMMRVDEMDVYPKDEARLPSIHLRNCRCNASIASGDDDSVNSHDSWKR